jgi:hypothetical protein
VLIFAEADTICEPDNTGNATGVAVHEGAVVWPYSRYRAMPASTVIQKGHELAGVRPLFTKIDSPGGIFAVTQLGVR